MTFDLSLKQLQDDLTSFIYLLPLNAGGSHNNGNQIVCDPHGIESDRHKLDFSYF